MTLIILILGRFVSFISRLLNLGSGGTWPGEIALRLAPDILKEFSDKVRSGVILVAGTNGKTTTSLMVKKILEAAGNKVIHNDSGANLLNGIVSSFIQNANWRGDINADWGVFEIDENSLPLVLNQINSHSGLRAGIYEKEDGSRVTHSLRSVQAPGMTKELIIVLLNLFRDQLDRYGEVDVIAQKWEKTLKKLPKETKIILNADDPLIAHLGMSLRAKVIYFGLNEQKLFQSQMEHATDSIFCLNCGNRLVFEGNYYSHLGIWNCPKCGEKRPKPDVYKWKAYLPGLYNQYNTLAAVSAIKTIGITDKQIEAALSDFAPAFGRQEEFTINSKKLKIFLSKNPAGFNESLRTVINLGARKLLLVLNDRIPDGRDVSWIWDVDFEMIPDNVSVIVSGDRAYDLGLRIKYAARIKNYNSKLKIIKNLREAIATGLDLVKEGETLYILPTYSAMLEVRKILKGKKIL